MGILVVVLQQQVVQQPRPKHPQEGHNVGGLGAPEENAGQEGKGDEGVAPNKKEEDLEAIVGEAEELEVDGGADQQQHGNVDTVDEEEPGVLDDPIGIVAQTVHLHHDSQPAQHMHMSTHTQATISWASTDSRRPGSHQTMLYLIVLLLAETIVRFDKCKLPSVLLTCQCGQ